MTLVRSLSCAKDPPSSSSKLGCANTDHISQVTFPSFLWSNNNDDNTLFVFVLFCVLLVVFLTRRVCEPPRVRAIRRQDGGFPSVCKSRAANNTEWFAEGARRSGQRNSTTKLRTKNVRQRTETSKETGPARRVRKATHPREKPM